MKRNIPRSKNSGRQGVKIPCQDWYALLDSQAGTRRGNLAAARELGGNLPKIATNIK
jgi:hypothetical protein